MNPQNDSRAILRAATPPSAESRERLLEFLRRSYGHDFELDWEQDDALRGGFILRAGADVYDWSVKGRLRQFRESLAAIDTGGDVLPMIKSAMADWKPEVFPEEYGRVVTVGDEIAAISGLENAAYGEILMFPSGVKGMVQELRENELGCILFGSGEEVAEGDRVRRSGKTAGIPVGDGFLGRVVDALGSPIDGKGDIKAEGYRAIERKAAEIIDRKPVSRPLHTGIMAIDALFPIGRGQRELIIGDRQTGKTAIAIDTIINQRGKDVICIYVAIGQKASSVAQVVETLDMHGSMDYTVVVCASAADSATMQYIAPYSGCTLGEYFMHKGRDVLIVYDDLSKHAIAYRALSLLLERSPGREAYPGDVFYLHSRLLERSAQLSDERGGGSMTALPIVETQAGDVSAYIPTNIISITDGQIFLESDLFFAGQRPAVNVGLSVSRVGGDAQTKAMKKAVGSLRIDLAQFREMEIFTQFSSDLDDVTRGQLEYGQSLMRLLIQPQYKPLHQHEEIVLLVAAMSHALQEVPVRRLPKMRERLLAYIERERGELCARIDATGQLSDSERADIAALSKAYVQKRLHGRTGA